MEILITDDHALFRDGLQYVLRQLQEDVTIFEADDCDEAVRVATEHKQLDLILLDLNMQGTHGIDALKILRTCAPSVPIVIVSGCEDPDTVKAALDCGAQGYIPKSSNSNMMLVALRLVLAGGIYIPTQLLDARLHDTGTEVPSTAKTADKADTSHGLTLRQLEVLSLICNGLSNKEICRALELAEGTVKIHVTAILKGLSVSSRTQAVIAAQKFGLTGRQTQAALVRIPVKMNTDSGRT